MRTFGLNINEVTQKVVDGEAIIINLATGTYYSIEGVGTFVWSNLVNGCSVGDVISSVASHYGAPVDRCKADVERFVDALLEEKLLVPTELAAEPVPVRHDDMNESERSYQNPELRAYHDMNDLLGMDPPMPGATPLPWDRGRDRSDSNEGS